MTDTEPMVVAVLGTGTMGAGMVRSLRRAGLEVRAWNRNSQRAAVLAGTGAQIVTSEREAAAGATVVLSMLFDTESVCAAVRAAQPSAGTIWLQSTTVGVEGVEATIELAAELGLVLVDCPVLGTRKPAEDGTLTMLASGPQEARAALAPVLDALGRRTVWLGPAGMGSRLKMAANAWVLASTVATAQSIALARGLGLDPQAFLDVIADSPSNSAYAQTKGAAMIAREFPVSFGLAGAAKDAALIEAATRAAGMSAALAETVQILFADAAGRSTEELDMAAVITAFGGS